MTRDWRILVDMLTKARLGNADQYQEKIRDFLCTLDMDVPILRRFKEWGVQEYREIYGDESITVFSVPDDGTEMSRNLCPVCRCDMGWDFPSQVCSRACLHML